MSNWRYRDEQKDALGILKALALMAQIGLSVALLLVFLNRITEYGSRESDKTEKLQPAGEAEK